MNELLKYNSNGPFDPTFGGFPTITIGIQNEIEAYHQFIKNNNQTWSLFITGIRGSGKTVFMNMLGHSFDNDPNYIIIDESTSKRLINDLIADLSQALANKIKQIKLTEISFSFANIKITFNRKKQITDQIKQLNQLINIAASHNYKLIFDIDEVSNIPAVKTISRQFNKYKIKHYPITFLMTGLPNQILDLSNYHNLTFLLRSEKIWCDQLPTEDMSIAYQKALKCSPDQAEFFAEATKQYPYAFQELGALLYRYHKPNEDYQNTYKLILPTYKNHLAVHAYDTIWQNLTNNEQHYLISITKSNRFSDIVKDLKKNKTTVNNYRIKLTKERVIDTLARGYVTFRLPFFKSYIRSKTKRSHTLEQFD